MISDISGISLILEITQSCPQTEMIKQAQLQNHNPFKLGPSAGGVPSQRSSQLAQLFVRAAASVHRTPDWGRIARRGQPRGGGSRRFLREDSSTCVRDSGGRGSSKKGTCFFDVLPQRPGVATGSR
jgi:hypothetical protein